MQNIKHSIKGSILTIEIDLDAPGQRSVSGKTTVLASTRGNQKIETPKGKTVHLGVNCYQY